MAKYNVTVTLTPEALKAAKKALRKRNLPVHKQFFGPEFKDVDDYEIDACGVTILTEDNISYFYPAHTVARVRVER